MWKLHQHSQFFFFSLRPDPYPLIRYDFPTIHVFSQFLHKKKTFSIHSEIVFMLHFVPVELMMTLVTLLQALQNFFYRNFFCHSILMILQRGKARGCTKLKKRPGVGIFFKDTPGWTTYLRNQAHFYIRKYDVSSRGACLPIPYQTLCKHHKPSCGVLSPIIHIGDDTR